MSLYTVQPVLSYAFMKNVVCIEGPRQVFFFSEFLQTVKKHILVQLIRICGMLCKSQTKNSLSHGAVTIYFNWPVICAASGKWETYL